MATVQSFYEELEHTADWAIRVWGDDLPALYEHAAAAMFELQGADLEAEPTITDEVTCSGIDPESLLVAWLNELLFASEINDALYTRFQVRVTPGADQSASSVLGPDRPLAEPDSDYVLSASIAGIPGRGHLAHVKAVTYYGLDVRQGDSGWEATVTFDT